MNKSIQSPPGTPNSAPDADSPQAIALALRSSSPKQQQQQIDALIQSEETAPLRLFVEQHDGPATVAVGQILQGLAQFSEPLAEGELDSWVASLVPLASDRGVDYQPLRDRLLAQDFEQADRITLAKLCELAGEAAVARKWLYFSEVGQFPSADLQTIDFLWRIFSQDKFGFSVQRELWLGVGQNWDRLWPKIGWRGDTWTRYPDGFTWSLTAPRGHLPLSNQLRGVRVMAALMEHPAWQKG